MNYHWFPRLCACLGISSLLLFSGSLANEEVSENRLFRGQEMEVNNYGVVENPHSRLLLATCPTASACVTEFAFYKFATGDFSGILGYDAGLIVQLSFVVCVLIFSFYALTLL